MNVVLIPSVSGGIGHIARTAVLARALCKFRPDINVEYVLDTERLRAFNIDAASATGFRVNLMPPRPRESRDAIVKLYLGRADIIIDDTSRYLVPLRKIVPQAAWISIPLYPVGDELFMDWPFLEQVEGIIWAYPEVMDYPAELGLVKTPLLRTGPFLETNDVPERSAARARLGLPADEEIVVYAPRGMPFGKDFGERVLGSIFGAVAALREQGRPLRLVLLAVRDEEEIRMAGIPAELPHWVNVVSVIPQAESLVYLRAADIAVTEGTSTTHEAAALGTSIVMVPGPIPETWMLGKRLHDHEAAHTGWIERITPSAVAEIFLEILTKPKEREQKLRRARDIVTGGGGAEAAARWVLDLHAEYLTRG